VIAGLFLAGVGDRPAMRPFFGRFVVVVVGGVVLLFARQARNGCNIITATAKKGSAGIGSREA
jgi:hypothetical protein